jgi:hypothetical protein
MHENESDAAAHTPQGVSFPGKKKILTKKDGITAKRVGRGYIARLIIVLSSLPYVFRNGSGTAGFSLTSVLSLLKHIIFNQFIAIWMRMCIEL